MGLAAVLPAYDMAQDVSARPLFNAAIGFTETEVRQAVAECTGFTARSKTAQAIVNTLRDWCGGYRFCPSTDGAAAADMFQTSMVLLLLEQLVEAAAGRSLSHAQVIEWLRAWQPFDAAGAAQETKLGDYFAQSTAMDALLPQLASNQPVAAPRPMSVLTVQQQIEAASQAPDPYDRVGHLLRTMVGRPLSSPAVEQAAARTWFHEGVLTYAKQQHSLCVPNQQAQRLLTRRLACVLVNGDAMAHAADAFLLHGVPAPLEEQLAAVGHSGTHTYNPWPFLGSSYLKLLPLLLQMSTAQMHWQLAMALPRVCADTGNTSSGSVDLIGETADGRRTIIIQYKQVNIATEIGWCSKTKALMDVGKAPCPRDRYDFHEARDNARHLPDSDLLRLRVRRPAEQGGSETELSVEELAAQAARLAREYARGWRLSHPDGELQLYAVVAVGPARWVVRAVPLPWEAK